VCAVGFAAAALLATSLGAAQKDKDKNQKAVDTKRPDLRLRAQPVIAMAPARIVLTAELVGGANDYEEFYCADTEWDWGDGTQSAHGADCEPYEEGKSEIKRRYTVEHVFRAGAFRVNFKLKRRDRTLALATVNLQIRPGLRDPGQ
jgi:hypothetical protein